MKLSDSWSLKFAASGLHNAFVNEHSRSGDSMDLSVSQIVFLAAIILFTVATTWTDLRSRKVLNTMTLPMWVAGWVWQFSFHGWTGLWDGLCGFGIGFGVLFVLWMVGSAGGGDVKLLGALSVWLGPGLTLRVMLGSLIFVILGTTAVVFGSMFTRGWKGTKHRFSREKDTAGGKRCLKKGETIAGRQKRRVMAFAMPVAIATWSVLLLFRGQW
jgi:prepilin peptidase CpaA